MLLKHALGTFNTKPRDPFTERDTVGSPDGGGEVGPIGVEDASKFLQGKAGFRISLFLNPFIKAFSYVRIVGRDYFLRIFRKLIIFLGGFENMLYTVIVKHIIRV